jgi:hypothetical protein
MTTFPTMESILQENESRIYSTLASEYAYHKDTLKKMMSPAVICGPGMVFATTYGAFSNWYVGAALGTAFAGVVIREIYRAEIGLKTTRQQLGQLK